MKIDKVIFSTSETFSIFWNLNSKLYKTKLGIEPVCLLFGDRSKTDMSEEFGKVIEVPIIPDLPLLIQMPFLFAYYRMLNVAMDLRHAPWLWVHDLSAPDPRYILPIAIVVTMFFMQRMTPQAGMDPTQQKMMNFMMPAMMGYISFNLPAGLSLYWAMGQLIGIVQQAALNRSSLGREMREMMAKRARKKEK